MGFSVSVSTLVIFLGLMIAASSFYGAWSFSQDELIKARDESLKDRTGIDQTDIEILDKNYDAGTYTINVSNNGSEPLNVSRTSIMINGSYDDPATKSVIGATGSGVWLPGEELQVTGSHPATPDRVKVSTDNGVSDNEVW